MTRHTSINHWGGTPQEKAYLEAYLSDLPVAAQNALLTPGTAMGRELEEWITRAEMGRTMLGIPGRLYARSAAAIPEEWLNPAPGPDGGAAPASAAEPAAEAGATPPADGQLTMAWVTEQIARAQAEGQRRQERALAEERERSKVQILELERALRLERSQRLLEERIAQFVVLPDTSYGPDAQAFCALVASYLARGEVTQKEMDMALRRLAYFVAHRIWGPLGPEVLEVLVNDDTLGQLWAALRSAFEAPADKPRSAEAALTEVLSDIWTKRKEPRKAAVARHQAKAQKPKPSFPKNGKGGPAKPAAAAAPAASSTGAKPPGGKA